MAKDVLAKDILPIEPLPGETVGQAFGRSCREEMARRILDGTPTDGMAIITSGIRVLVASRVTNENAKDVGDCDDGGTHVEIDAHGLDGNFDGNSNIGSGVGDSGVNENSDNGGDVADDADHYGDDSIDFGGDSDPGM